MVGLRMVTGKIGYLIEDSIIWKTTDSGLSWTPTIWHGWKPYVHNVAWSGGSLEHIFFLNENMGFATGFYDVPFDTNQNTLGKDYGIMFRTKDAGATWDTLDYGYRNRIYGMYFWDEKNGIITCDSGNVMKTSDGGDSWRLAYKISGMAAGQSRLSDVNFISEKVGYITANPPKIFITTDGGESWSLDADFTTSTQGISSITKIVFPDSNTVMVTGFQGVLRKKIDLNKLSVKTESIPVSYYAWITIKQNPVSNELFCKLYWITPQTKTVSLRIYDMLGRSMYDFSNDLQQMNSTMLIACKFLCLSCFIDRAVN